MAENASSGAAGPSVLHQLLPNLQRAGEQSGAPAGAQPAAPVTASPADSLGAGTGTQAALESLLRAKLGIGGDNAPAASSGSREAAAQLPPESPQKKPDASPSPVASPFKAAPAKPLPLSNEALSIAVDSMTVMSQSGREQLTAREVKAESRLCLYKYPVVHTYGHLCASNGEFIAYVIQDAKRRVGVLRVLHRLSAVRSLISEFNGDITDISFFGESINLLAVACTDGTCSVLRLAKDPAEESINVTPILRAKTGAPLSHAVWHPQKRSVLAAASAESVLLLNVDEILQHASDPDVDVTSSSAVRRVSVPCAPRSLSFRFDGSVLAVAHERGVAFVDTQSNSLRDTAIVQRDCSCAFYAGQSSVLSGNDDVLVVVSDHGAAIELRCAVSGTLLHQVTLTASNNANHNPAPSWSHESEREMWNQSSCLASVALDPTGSFVVVAEAKSRSLLIFHLSGEGESCRFGSVAAFQTLQSTLSLDCLTQVQQSDVESCSLGNMFILSAGTGAIEEFRVDAEWITDTPVVLRLRVVDAPESVDNETAGSRSPSVSVAASSVAANSSSPAHEHGTVSSPSLLSPAALSLPSRESRHEPEVPRSGTASAKGTALSADRGHAAAKPRSGESGESATANTKKPVETSAKSTATINAADASGSSDVAPALRRLEKSLAEKMRKQADRAEKASANAVEQLQKRVSALEELVRQTTQVWEQERATQLATHREQIKELLSSVSQTVGAAVTRATESEVSRATKALEAQLEAKIEAQGRISAEMSAQLIQRELASHIVPAITHEFRQAFMGTLVPAFERATRSMFEQIVEAVPRPAPAVSGISTPTGSVGPAGGIGGLFGGGGGFFGAAGGPFGAQQQQQGLLSPAQTQSAGGSGPSATTGAPQTPVDARDYMRLVAEEKYNDAFTRALSANDLQVVTWLCSLVEPTAAMFASAGTPHPTHPSALVQPVTLSLIQQLAFDLRSFTDLKARWLKMALLYVDASDVVIAPHCPGIIGQVMHNAESAAASASASERAQLAIVSQLARALLA